MRSRVAAGLGWAGGAVVVGFVVLPLWYMVVLSLDPDPVSHASTLWPQALSLDNYRFLSAPVFRFYPALLRSLLLSAGTTLASMVVAVPAAYALGRLTVRGQSQLLAGLITLAFFPGIVLVVPIGKVFADIGWLDRLYGIGFAQLSFTLPLALWFLAYAFRSVPRDVEEAAMMDGAGLGQRIVRVILPIARPGVAGATVIVFVASWNDFLFGSTLNRSTRSETLPVLLSKLPTIGFLGGQMAASVLMCIPVVLVVVALLRWLAGRAR